MSVILSFFHPLTLASWTDCDIYYCIENENYYGWKDMLNTNFIKKYISINGGLHPPLVLLSEASSSSVLKDCESSPSVSQQSQAEQGVGSNTTGNSVQENEHLSISGLKRESIFFNKLDKITPDLSTTELFLALDKVGVEQLRLLKKNQINFRKITQQVIDFDILVYDKFELLPKSVQNDLVNLMSTKSHEVTSIYHNGKFITIPTYPGIKHLSLELENNYYRYNTSSYASKLQDKNRLYVFNSFYYFTDK